MRPRAQSLPLPTALFALGLSVLVLTMVGAGLAWSYVPLLAAPTTPGTPAYPVAPTTAAAPTSAAGAGDAGSTPTGGPPATTPRGHTDYEPPPKDPRKHFAHRVRTTFQAAQARVAGLPARDFYGWRVIFKKHFRPVFDSDLVDHEASIVNPYVIDVNYRTRRIPRSVELNQGTESNINIEVNQAAYNLLGFADNRGVIAGFGLAVEKRFPFRTSDRHFGGVKGMLRLTDQHHHAFDFVLSAAESEVIDREYSNHYGGTISYTYANRFKPGGPRWAERLDINLPFQLYGYAITDFTKRESDNTAQEADLLRSLGQPFASFQFRDITREIEPRRRDAVAFSATPSLELRPLGLEIIGYSFVQQGEHKESPNYVNSKNNPLTFREDGIGYRTRFIRYGLAVEKTFALTGDLDFRLGASQLRVRRSYHVRYEVNLDPATLQAQAPIPVGLTEILPECGFSLDGLVQRFSCDRITRDRQSTGWVELEVRRVFLNGHPPAPGSVNVPHDLMRFRLSLVRYEIGRNPRTNLFDDDDLNKLIFPNELTTLPTGIVGNIPRNQTAEPRALIRREVRLEMSYELAGFEFAHTIP